jgi:hypothetical protein
MSGNSAKTIPSIGLPFANLEWQNTDVRKVVLVNFHRRDGSGGRPGAVQAGVVPRRVQDPDAPQPKLLT